MAEEEPKPHAHKMMQLKALMWKNLMIRSRQKTALIVDLVVVGLSLLILVGLRDIQNDITEIPAHTPPAIELELTSQSVSSFFLPYSPISAATVDLMNVLENMSTVGSVWGFNDKEEAAEVFTGEFNNKRLPLVTFTNVDSDTTTMPSQLSLNITSFDVTEMKHLEIVHVLIATAFINYHRHKDGLNPVTFHIAFQQIPQPAWTIKGGFASTFKFYLKCMGLFLCTVMMALLRLVVQERELRLKEALKLMGVSTQVYWISWYLTGIIFFLPAVVVMTLVCSLPVGDGAAMGATNPLIFYLWLQLYVINFQSLCFVVSGFLKKASFTPGVVIFIVVFGPVLYKPMTKKVGDDWTWNLLISIVFFPLGFYKGVDSLTLKMQDDGYGFTNLMSAVGKDGEDHYSLFDSFMFMTLNTLFYTFLIWYFDNIHPGEYGIPQPFYFCFMPSYWKSNPVSAEGADLELPPQDELYFEQEPQDLEVGVKVQNLVKVFGKNVAVAGTNMNIYKNQITVLLGHNGAGKTTTLAMITGFLSPSKGTAIINGYDIKTQTYKARKSMGLCPQHDILFDLLTCTEHLRFYLWLRGETAEMRSNRQKLLTEVGLQYKMDTYAKNLSGGQKRKLSVATAVIGSEVVILDEPSSGLDPSARREMWVFLSSIRQDRTLLLTTHYMDEAEFLGDRIAIMASGVIKCCGTGYQMNVVIKPDCKPATLTTFIQKILPGARYLDSSHTEVYFMLPEEDMKVFPDLFLQLEENLEKLGISSFGLNATTLEEVFIKVGEGFDPNTDRLGTAPTINDKNETEKNIQDLQDMTVAESQSNVNQSSHENQKTELLDFNKNYVPNTGSKRKLQQMKAVLIKRLHITKRSWIVMPLFFLVLPVAGVALGLYTDIFIKDITKDIFKSYNFEPFKDDTKVYVWQHPGVDDKLVSIYMHLFPENKAERVTEETDVIQYYFDKGKDNDLGAFLKSFKTAAVFLEANDTYVEATALHGVDFEGKVVSVKLLLESLIKHYVDKEGSGFSSEYIDTTVQFFSDVLAKETLFATLVLLCLCMAILPTVFIHQLIQERQRGSRHLQQISGIDPVSFWIPNFCTDLVIYMVTVGCIMLTMYVMSPYNFIYGYRGYVFLVALLLHGMAILTSAYFLQMLFTTPAQGVTLMVVCNIAGAFGCMVVGFLDGDGKSKSTTVEVIIDLGFLMSLISPIYNLSASLSTLQVLYMGFGDTLALSDYFEDEDMQHGLIKMAAQFIYYFVFVFVIDFQLLRQLRYKSLPAADIERLKETAKVVESAEADDDDVIAERQRIQDTPIDKLIEENPLVVKNASKVYGRMLAVDNMHLGLSPNECFGLLGQNGAGKSTAFKMLTGDVGMSRGDIYFLRQDIKTSLNSILEHIGYCPQFDALDDNLTGRETLYLYARLRGVPEEKLDFVATQLMEHLTITPHADKLTCRYSGGNKRKLSVGISLIGNPDFILLDEPTAGIDPAARRALWEVLKCIRGAGKTIILTSHSMEECEALCTRVAIMVTGRFRCLGSLQHLKNKFAQGVAIFVKMASPATTEEERVPFLNFLSQSFGDIAITENKPDYVQFMIMGKDTKWSTIFRMMESSREAFDVSNYSVQQTSLEQIFLMFVRGANPPIRGRWSQQQACMNLICE